MRVNMREAKSQLSRLAALAWAGEQIVICRAGRPWLRLVPYEGRTDARQLGGLEGQIRMSEDFDKEDAELAQAIEHSSLFPGEH